MTPNEMIEVIAAHRDGKTIQFVLASCNKIEWADCSPSRHTTFDFTNFMYRIKPVPETIFLVEWEDQQRYSEPQKQYFTSRYVAQNYANYLKTLCSHVKKLRVFKEII